MKKSMCLLSGVLCLFLISCQTSVQENSEILSDEMQIAEIPLPDETSADEMMPDESPAEEEIELWDDDTPAYVKAYTEFLLYEDIDPDSLFPIRGYYLFDLNFDDIPELGVLHHSWGSAGGYFTLYYYDGDGISRILNDRGEPVQISNYTEILADYEQKKVYLLKEMFLLVGNENGTYGYEREIKSEGQVPCVYDILKLDVDQEKAMERLFADASGMQHENEDGFLLDSELEEYLITQRYSEEEWIPISSSEYLELKRELIPEENSFVDVRLNEDLNYLGGPIFDEDGDGFLMDVRMEKEEIVELFSRYMESVEE